jgi:hypothetical protein
MAVAGSVITPEPAVTDFGAPVDPAVISGPASTVIIPVTRQGHPLLHAEWGCWVTEKAAYPMVGPLRAGLELLADLRARGLRERECHDPAPRPDLHERLGVTLPEVVEIWVRLGPLRAHPDLLDAFLRITRQPKETKL